MTPIRQEQLRLPSEEEIEGVPVVEIKDDDFPPIKGEEMAGRYLASCHATKSVYAKVRIARNGTLLLRIGGESKPFIPLGEVAAGFNSSFLEVAIYLRPGDVYLFYFQPIDTGGRSLSVLPSSEFDYIVNTAARSGVKAAPILPNITKTSFVGSARKNGAHGNVQLRFTLEGTAYETPLTGEREISMERTFDVGATPKIELTMKCEGEAQPELLKGQLKKIP